MIRAKLIEAREKKGLTQEQAAEALGIAVTTLYRWERNESEPQGRNKWKLIELYGTDDLGLNNERATPLSPIIHLPGVDLLETRLLAAVFQWPRNVMKYDGLQESVRTISEGPMDKDRRRAVELLTTLPISVFGLSPARATTSVVAEELFPWLAAGITAAWKLGRNNDLAVADLVVASYLPSLLAVANSPRHRKTAANLAAQAYLLRVTMGWHLGGANDAVVYGLQAEKWSDVADDAILHADAMHRTGMAYFYGRRYDEALGKIEETMLYVRRHPVPSSMMRHLYLDLATYQARCGKVSDAKVSMRQASRHHATEEPTALALGYGDEIGLVRWEGLALASSNQHDDALNCYKQANDLLADRPTAERIRIELLNNQLHSMLKQPSRDKEECVKLWVDAISSAQALKSEQRFNEAVHLLDMMQVVWPGERDILELSQIATHW